MEFTTSFSRFKNSLPKVSYSSLNVYEKAWMAYDAILDITIDINCFPSQVLFSDRLGSKFNTLGINFDILGSDFNRWGKRSVFGSSPGDGGKCSDLQLR